MSTDYNDLKKIDNDGNPLVGNAGAIAIQQRILTAQIKSRGPAHDRPLTTKKKQRQNSADVMNTGRRRAPDSRRDHEQRPKTAGRGSPPGKRNVPGRYARRNAAIQQHALAARKQPLQNKGEPGGVIMGVSEMQIEHRVRPVIAEMEKGLFKVVDALQKETLATDVARVRSDFMQDLTSSLGQYREPPVLRRRHPGDPRRASFHSEKRKRRRLTGGSGSPPGCQVLSGQSPCDRRRVTAPQTHDIQELSPAPQHPDHPDPCCLR